MNVDLRSIGARIQFTRVANGLSQEQLAAKAGLSRVYIGYIERGERLPSLDAIIGIANALSISVDDLLSGNLMVDGSKLDPDEVAVLHDCSFEERRIILETMKYLKSILRGYTITK